MADVKAPDLFDTSQVPDDAAHWDALAARVADGVARTSGGGGFAWCANSAGGWVAASLLLAAALAFIVQPADDPPEGSIDALWVQALAPTDDMGQAILLSSGPPRIGDLLFTVRDEEAR